jgi:hypothetical protein
MLAEANKKQYFWFIFDRETGLLHSPGTVPGKKGAPGLNIKFNKLSALMQSAINFVYGGSSQQNMLAAPYYPKGQKPPRHHSFKFFNISLHFPTHDGICGMPALITTLNQFMDKSKPYPDSLKKMIQTFQDRGTYVNGEPLQEKDKIKEKLYDMENERVIHPNGIAYQYINECLDKGEEPRDSQLMYRIREYRNKYPIDTLQAKAQAEKEVEALEGKLSLKEQRKKETFARIERLKAMMGDSEEHDK